MSDAIREEAWTQTYTGLCFKPFAPTIAMVCIDDIAHALSLMCRYNGHCRFHYSVAQHSLLVSHELQKDRFPAHVQLLGLLHDAAEAYCGDMVAPLKRHMPEFREVEDRIEGVIWTALGIEPPDIHEKHTIKVFDLRALVTEKRDLHHDEPQSWEVNVEPFPEVIPEHYWRDMQIAFLRRYAELRRQGAAV